MKYRCHQRQPDKHLGSNPRRAVVGLVFVWVVSFSEDASAAELVQLERLRVGSQLVDVTNEAIEVRLDKESIHVPFSQLIRWGRYTEQESRTIVVLMDGSLLKGEFLSLAQDRLHLHQEPIGDLLIPRKWIRGVLLSPSLDPLQRDRDMQRLFKNTNAASRLWLRNGDFMEGEIAAIREEGELFGVTQLQLTSTGSANVLPVDTDRVEAILFANEDDAPPVEKIPVEKIPVEKIPVEKIAVEKIAVGLEDGSLLQLKSIRRRAEQLVLTLVSGLELQVVHEAFLEHVTMVQPFGYGVAYLSDQEEQSYKHIPFFDVHHPWRADLNVLGGKLRSGGQTYLKGLGMHSASQLSYEVPPGFTHFQARVALDSIAQGGGSVVLRVFLSVSQEDGSDEWQQAFGSRVLRGDDAPVDVTIPVAEARRLALLVEYADQGDVLDYVDWLEARWVKIEESVP